METPSSTRRITRSQTMALSNSANKNAIFSRNIEDSQKKGKTTSKQDRSPLIDISNDSPIVGLASGNFIATPLSSVTKQKSKNCCKKTPGSGEALLRGQVKNLLQKVEEEAEITNKVSFKSCGLLRRDFKAIFNSPAALVAPTPVNTPQVLNFSDVEDFDSFSFVSEPPIEDQLKKLPQVINGIIDDDKKQTEASSRSENDLISRTLFLEFSEKSDSSLDCSSVVTYQGTTEVNSKSEEKTPSIEEDDASIWSIQANASTQDDEDEYEVNQVGVEFDESYADNDEYYDVGIEGDIPDLDELCEGINNMSVDGEKKGPKFMGKHTRFVYNSDDELVEEREEDDSDGILHLKGLPTPKGKHVRFQDEDGEEN